MLCKYTTTLPFYGIQCKHMQQHKMYITIQKFLRAHARYVTPAALSLGFIIDNIILQQIDSLFTFSIILYHFTLISLGILLLHATHGASEHRKYVQLMRTALSIIVPFSFGALFSGFFIFYSQSAGSLLSWLFLAALILFMISTEYYKKHYLHTVVQVTLWYFTLLSFLVLYLPIALREMNGAVFLLAGICSLFITGGFLSLLSRIEPHRYNNYAVRIVRNIALVLVTISTLYFTNIIPPIPLAMKHMGAYYSVERVDDNYKVTTQEYAWYSPNRYLRTTLYHMPGNAVYVFSSIFAPERLSPKLYHKWQYKGDSGKWQTISTIDFAIIGGRSNGYRGYTQKENVWPGLWRVQVITERGQVVGTTTFTIVDAEVLPELVEVVY